MPILVAARLLKPLGNPAANGIKFFSASELLQQVKERAWLAKVTNALNQHWQKRNAAKKSHPANGSPNCNVTANGDGRNDLDNSSTKDR
jgi:hypothetical protein